MNTSKDAGSDDRRLAGVSEIRREVESAVSEAEVIDIHTHLFPQEFGELNLFGIDNLLTYHYLVAEMFRYEPVLPGEFWRCDKQSQADMVWRTLFVENTPLSEAARGVITILSAFGLDPGAETLREARRFFASQAVESHIDRVLTLSRVTSLVMTNDLFDPNEMKIWNAETSVDSRFHTALRMDTLLNTWPSAVEFLSTAGYNVDLNLAGSTITEIRRYFDRCVRLMKPLYMAVSLPDDFQFPADDIRTRIINEIVIPAAKDSHLPFALMTGVRRGVNPALQAAGDGVGRADVSSIERICVQNPDVRFLATFLSRENQHELCVAARKFSNLTPFGCWWFLNNPSIIAEITNERLEMLGTSFIPQHSDARVLEQLIYKWRHSRRVISDCLASSYERLAETGRTVTRNEIERDVRQLFSGNFARITGLTQ